MDLNPYAVAPATPTIIVALHRIIGGLQAYAVAPSVTFQAATIALAVFFDVYR